MHSLGVPDTAIAPPQDLIEAKENDTRGTDSYASVPNWQATKWCGTSDKQISSHLDASGACHLNEEPVAEGISGKTPSSGARSCFVAQGAVHTPESSALRRPSNCSGGDCNPCIAPRISQSCTAESMTNALLPHQRILGNCKNENHRIDVGASTIEDTLAPLYEESSHSSRIQLSLNSNVASIQDTGHQCRLSQQTTSPATPLSCSPMHTLDRARNVCTAGSMFSQNSTVHIHPYHHDDSFEDSVDSPTIFIKRSASSFNSIPKLHVVARSRARFSCEFLRSAITRTSHETPQGHSSAHCNTSKNNIGRAFNPSMIVESETPDYVAGNAIIGTHVSTHEDSLWPFNSPDSSNSLALLSPHADGHVSNANTISCNESDYKASASSNVSTNLGDQLTNKQSEKYSDDFDASTVLSNNAHINATDAPGLSGYNATSSMAHYTSRQIFSQSVEWQGTRKDIYAPATDPLYESDNGIPSTVSEECATTRSSVVKQASFLQDKMKMVHSETDICKQIVLFTDQMGHTITSTSNPRSEACHESFGHFCVERDVQTPTTPNILDSGENMTMLQCAAGACDDSPMQKLRCSCQHNSAATSKESRFHKQPPRNVPPTKNETLTHGRSVIRSMEHKATESVSVTHMAYDLAQLDKNVKQLRNNISKGLLKGIAAPPPTCVNDGSSEGGVKQSRPSSAQQLGSVLSIPLKGFHPYDESSAISFLISSARLETGGSLVSNASIAKEQDGCHSGSSDDHIRSINFSEISAVFSDLDEDSFIDYIQQRPEETGTSNQQKNEYSARRSTSFSRHTYHKIRPATCLSDSPEPRDVTLSGQEPFVRKEAGPFVHTLLKAKGIRCDAANHSAKHEEELANTDIIFDMSLFRTTLREQACLAVECEAQFISGDNLGCSSSSAGSLDANRLSADASMYKTSVSTTASSFQLGTLHYRSPRRRRHVTNNFLKIISTDQEVTICDSHRISDASSQSAAAPTASSHIPTYQRDGELLVSTEEQGAALHRNSSQISLRNMTVDLLTCLDSIHLKPLQLLLTDLFTSAHTGTTYKLAMSALLLAEACQGISFFIERGMHSAEGSSAIMGSSSYHAIINRLTQSGDDTHALLTNHKTFIYQHIMQLFAQERELSGETPDYDYATCPIAFSRVYRPLDMLFVYNALSGFPSETGRVSTDFKWSGLFPESLEVKSFRQLSQVFDTELNRLSIDKFSAEVFQTFFDHIFGVLTNMTFSKEWDRYIDGCLKTRSRLKYVTKAQSDLIRASKQFTSPGLFEKAALKHRSSSLRSIPIQSQAPFIVIQETDPRTNFADNPTSARRITQYIHRSVPEFKQDDMFGVAQNGSPCVSTTFLCGYPLRNTVTQEAKSNIDTQHLLAAFQGALCSRHTRRPDGNTEHHKLSGVTSNASLELSDMAANEWNRYQQLLTLRRTSLCSETLHDKTLSGEPQSIPPSRRSYSTSSVSSTVSSLLDTPSGPGQRLDLQNQVLPYIRLIGFRTPVNSEEVSLAVARVESNTPLDPLARAAQSEEPALQEEALVQKTTLPPISRLDSIKSTPSVTTLIQKNFPQFWEIMDLETGSHASSKNLSEHECTQRTP